MGPQGSDDRSFHVVIFAAPDDPHELAEGVEPPKLLPRPNGCPSCRNTGFKGRIGVFEAVRTQGPIAEAIQRGTAEDELRRMIRAAGTTSLMADALGKVRDGVTSLDEALAIKWA